MKAAKSKNPIIPLVLFAVLTVPACDRSPAQPARPGPGGSRIREAYYDLYGQELVILRSSVAGN
jgi:hypothetical protein